MGPRSEPGDHSPVEGAAAPQLGVTRLSLGVQSWDDALLRTLGRIHTAAEAEETYHVLRDAGFDNINIDLMFAVPGQTLEQWRATLEKTIALQPEHVSSYCLTYEEDTEYFRKLGLGEYRQDDERDAQLFEMTMDALAAAGFAPLRDLQLRAPRPRIAAQSRLTGSARIISASARAPSPRAACTAGKTFPTPRNTRAACSPANR